MQQRIPSDITWKVVSVKRKGITYYYTVPDFVAARNKIRKK